MSLAKRAASGILWAQIGKIAETALAFLLSVIVVRRLGPDAYGEYGLVLGLLGFGYLLTSLGFRQILGKHIPRLIAENDFSGVSFLLRWAFGWRLGLTLVLVLVFVALLDLVARVFHLPTLRLYLWPFVLLFLGRNLYLLLISFFNAVLRMKWVLIINLVLWSVSLAFVLLFFHWYGASVVAVLYASALATNLAFCVGLFFARDWLFGGDSSPLPTRPLWRFGTTIWLTDFANFGLGTETDVLFMGYFIPDKAQIGFYRAAVMPVQRLMGFLFGAWSGLTMPVLSEAHATHGSEGVRRAWTSYIKLVALLALPLLILLAVFAEPILTLLYSDQYAYSARLLQLYIAFKMVGFAIGHGLSTGMLQTLGQEGLALRLRLLAGVSNVLLNVALIPLWGAAGALVSTGLSGLLIWSIETAVVVRRYNLRYPWSFLIKVLLASICAAIVSYLLPDGGWLGLITGGVVYVLIFLFLFYLLKPLSVWDKTVLLGVAPRMEKLIRFL